MTQKPIQYLLVGLPYSGKTTLAKELVSRLGFAYINIGQLKWDKGYSDVGDDDVPDKVWKEIFEKADKLILKYLNEGKNLANEYAWVTKKWRDRARKVVANAGFETRTIYLKIPVEEVNRRWIENIKTKNHFHWPKDEFNNYLRDFEEPTLEENVILYDQSIPFDNWVKKNNFYG
jgi:predicted kinase